MGAWVDVKDRMPVIQEATKLKVKILCGSIYKKEIEEEILAMPWRNSARFMVGDWRTVTHWFEE